MISRRRGHSGAHGLSRPRPWLQYLLAATILAGIIQVLTGFARLGYVMHFVSRSVLTGFVNALAILIFIAQLPELIGVSPATYVMVAAGLAIIYLFPRLTKAIPSPLVCIVVLTVAALGHHVRTVSDLGELPSDLPTFLIPDVPFTLETLWIILPCSAAVAAAGLLESLRTASRRPLVRGRRERLRMRVGECTGIRTVFADRARLAHRRGLAIPPRSLDRGRGAFHSGRRCRDEGRAGTSSSENLGDGAERARATFESEHGWSQSLRASPTRLSQPPLRSASRHARRLSLSHSSTPIISATAQASPSAAKVSERGAGRPSIERRCLRSPSGRCSAR